MVQGMSNIARRITAISGSRDCSLLHASPSITHLLSLLFGRQWQVARSCYLPTENNIKQNNKEHAHVNDKDQLWLQLCPVGITYADIYSKSFQVQTKYFYIGHKYTKKSSLKLWPAVTFRIQDFFFRKLRPNAPTT